MPETAPDRVTRQLAEMRSVGAALHRKQARQAVTEALTGRTEGGNSGC